MLTIDQIARNVESKEDFIGFISTLIHDLKINPDSWENKSLETYLEALQGRTEDMEGYYINNNQPVPRNTSWKVFAEILAAARVYE